MQQISKQDSDWALELFSLIDDLEERAQETLEKAPDQKQHDELEHNMKLFKCGVLVMIRLLMGKWLSTKEEIEHDQI